MTDTMVFSLVIVGVLIVLLGVIRLRHVSVQSLILGLIGAILGLLLGALASVPLSKLPQPLGEILPMAVSITLTLVLMGVVVSRRRSLSQLPFLNLERSATDAPATSEPTVVSSLPPILVDTSVIIDGRIADIATAGFVPGRLFVPRFVLAELQNIADSDDAMRRGRGRRGLDVLNRLREMDDLEVEIIEDDVPAIREVDAKLVALGQKFKCNVLTTDYNLNRVAQIQGVRVLNVNELSNAIRPVVLPGEELIVRVVQPGKERNQGVGYLADGTMIVVENGDKLMGQDVATEVTRVFQTVAGKMIFAVPRKPVPGVEPTAPADDPTTVPPSTRTMVSPSAAQRPAKTDVAKSETSSKAETPKPDAQKSDKPEGDAANRRGRFGNRKRGRGGNGNGNNGGNGGSSRPGSIASIEDRLIAATEVANHNPDQNQPSSK